MRLFSTRYKKRDPAGITAERYSLDWHWFGLYWQYEIQMNNDKWQPYFPYRGFEINKNFMFGFNELYYDGYHRAFSLGFLHINWYT